jgi:2-C-methyl-D-erythritol 4-phosphate cytidylyltransferase
MVSAIIVAAGKGTRMGPNVDKLFLEVSGRPVIAHTWDTFDRATDIQEIVIVVRQELQSAFVELARKYQFNKPFRIAPGGARRQDSVWNGLERINPQTQIVVIQDGARPCTSAELITATISAARETGAAVAAQPVTDTIKESSDGVLISRTLQRERLWAVQTPQTFQLDVIRRALTEVRNLGLDVTDDTAACEVISQPVRLVVRKEPNPKVTQPEDLVTIALLLEKKLKRD